MPQLQINQGPQDALLYDNTRSYFTNVGYVRTSNFQMELRDVQPVSQAQFGSRVDYVIPKSADLLGPIDLIVDLNKAEVPSGTAANNIGNYSAWVELARCVVARALVDAQGRYSYQRDWVPCQRCTVYGVKAHVKRNIEYTHAHQTTH